MIVHSLVHGSDEQIDTVIDFIDEEHACDQELRQLIHEFFRRSLLASNDQ